VKASETILAYDKGRFEHHLGVDLGGLAAGAAA